MRGEGEFVPLGRLVVAMIGVHKGGGLREGTRLDCKHYRDHPSFDRNPFLMRMWPIRYP